MKIMFLGGHSHASRMDIEEPPPPMVVVDIPLTTWLDGTGQGRAFRCIHQKDVYRLKKAAGGVGDQPTHWWWYYATDAFESDEVDLLMAMPEKPFALPEEERQWPV